MSHEVFIEPTRHFPQIAIDPPEEGKRRDHINLLLKLADQHVSRFAQAVSLIQHCEQLLSNQRREPFEWMGIAMRDAALSIYHFGVTLRAIRSGMKACPTLGEQVDVPKLREADKAFARDFPDAEQLRHAVSHIAEQLSTPEKVNELRRPGEFLVWESSVGSHFAMASPKGRQVRLNIDRQSLEKLQITLANLYDAFAGADPARIPSSG